MNAIENKEVIEQEMEIFINENPYADSYELAHHFFCFGMKFLEKEISDYLNNVV